MEIKTYNKQNKIQRGIMNTYRMFKPEPYKFETYTPKIKKWKVPVFLTTLALSVPIPGVTPLYLVKGGLWMLK